MGDNINTTFETKRGSEIPIQVHPLVDEEDLIDIFSSEELHVSDNAFTSTEDTRKIEYNNYTVNIEEELTKIHNMEDILINMRSTIHRMEDKLNKWKIIALILGITLFYNIVITILLKFN